jgi:hypothetical protein
MDRESFLRLVHLLSTQPGNTGQTPVMCFFAPLATGEDTFDKPLVVTHSLDGLAKLYDWDAVHGPPGNVWPLDRSWFVYTDWDLSGTRVGGSPDLVASVVADSQLETVSYP